MIDQINAVSRPGVLSNLERTLVSRNLGSMPKMRNAGPKLRAPRLPGTSARSLARHPHMGFNQWTS